MHLDYTDKHTQKSKVIFKSKVNLSLTLLVFVLSWDVNFCTLSQKYTFINYKWANLVPMSI